jgi:hypothetical protein
LIPNTTNESLTTRPKDSITDEKTNVLHGGENILKIVLQFISKSNGRIYACLDHTRPSLAVEIQEIREALIGSRNRGVRSKFITEITKYNISYCKRLIPVVNEVLHLDGIEGTFHMNEIQYLAPAALHDKGKPASEIIYSNVKELLEHQQYIFDTLWNKSIPAEEKIREIEEGIVPASFEVFQSTQEGIERAWRMLRSAKEEVFIMFSTTNAFRTQAQMGILQLLNERVKQYPNIEIKILIPAGEQIAETIKKTELDSQHVDFRIYEHALEGMGYFLVDKKRMFGYRNKR